ncbi:OmpA family protein [Sphingomonas sp. LT1P40]|uniref:OmpA family protein n=1 Tax=Alteristakelama amylovorans TaxID=3096166 RepID=UPI002FC961D4
MIALAGCSDNAPIPANVTAPSTAASPAAIATPAAGANLTGSTSALNGNISGLSVHTSETRIMIDLPADTLFEFDRADLTDAASTNLAKVAELIRQSPAGAVEVIGYTDAKGNDAYNLTLSQQRAQSVADWMSQQIGVRQRQFTVTGKGKADPVAANEAPDGKDNPAGRAQNRRVVVSIPR